MPVLRVVFISKKIQHSVHPPNAYICANLNRLLPTWSTPVRSMLVVLQPCQHTLLERTTETEASKDQLRTQFLDFGTKIALSLIALGHSVDIFDPKTGLPLLSAPGSLRLDDVAIVHSALKYPINNNGSCSIIIHPDWGNAVYPSTLVSSAPPYILGDVTNRVVESEFGEAIGASGELD